MAQVTGPARFIWPNDGYLRILQDQPYLSRSAGKPSAVPGDLGLREASHVCENHHMEDLQSEPLNALAQVLLAPSAKQRLRAAATRRHVKTSTLQRMILMEWLDEHEPAART